MTLPKTGFLAALVLLMVFSWSGCALPRVDNDYLFGDEPLTMGMQDVILLAVCKTYYAEYFHWPTSLDDIQGITLKKGQTEHPTVSPNLYKYLQKASFTQQPDGSLFIHYQYQGEDDPGEGEVQVPLTADLVGKLLSHLAAIYHTQHAGWPQKLEDLKPVARQLGLPFDLRRYKDCQLTSTSDGGLEIEFHCLDRSGVTLWNTEPRDVDIQLDAKGETQ